MSVIVAEPRSGTATRKETPDEVQVMQAVDRIVAEIERALFDEDLVLASELHAAVISPAADPVERADRVLEIGWRLAAEDRLLRCAS